MSEWRGLSRSIGSCRLVQWVELTEESFVDEGLIMPENAVIVCRPCDAALETTQWVRSDGP